MKLKPRRRTFVAYNKEYELGQRTLIDLLNSQNQYFNANVSLVTARGVTVFADYQLLAAMGQLLSYPEDRQAAGGLSRSRARASGSDPVSPAADPADGAGAGIRTAQYGSAPSRPGIRLSHRRWNRKPCCSVIAGPRKICRTPTHCS